MKLNLKRAGVSCYVKIGLIVGCFYADCSRVIAEEKNFPEYQKNGAFMLKNDKELHVKYKGRTLIEKDEINYLEGFEQADKLILDNKDGKAIINVIKEKSDKLQYRKEVAMDKDGNIELNLSMKLFPYKNDSEKNVIEYSFYVPFELLKNTTYKAYTGRGHAPKELEGKITDNMPDGSTITRNRFIAFNGNGVDLVFDFNPMGVWVRGDYCRNGQPVACWNMKKEGNYIKFSFAARASLDGGVFSSKIMIYEGKYDYDVKHAYKEWDYTGKTQPHFQFSFGTVDAPKDFRKADLEVHNNKQGWGWSNIKNLSLLKTKNTGIINNCVYSDTGNGTFIIDIIPGCYVITLQVCNKEKDVGPFDILLNGKECAKDISVKAGNLQIITLAQYLKNTRQLKIEFTGKTNWSVSSIVVQPVIYQNEDYTFDRALWNVEGLFVPDNLTVITKPEYLAKDISFAGRTMFEACMTEKKPGCPFELKKDILLPADSEKLNWRWDARMEMLGGCQSTRTEFNSHGAIERRINELAIDGYKSVMISGLHVHNSFLDKMDLWTEYTKRIVREAHKYGIKVIEHYDITIAEYSGMGLHYFIKHLDCLQRDFRNIPTFRAYCLNNSAFRGMCLRRLEKIVKETGVDGVMLDECTFAGKEFCACEHCRRKFTEDTGYVLPLDESSEVFCNKKSPLWITWLNWRKKSIGDWWIDVRKTLNKVNPDASLVIYATDNGFTRNEAALTLGFDLAESARACDFLGTEVMPRNVFDCYRSVNAYRKTRSALGDYFKSPLFNIIYHCGDKNFAYFGWILCHMNKQTALMATIEGEDMKKYIDWPYQMQNRFARSLADVAILFSAQSRDFNLFSSHARDAIGWSEVLSDAHITHDFILDEDISLDKLKNYKVLVLPSSGAMSRKQIETIKEYVLQGGNLIVSGISSLADENGFAYENFQLADVLGVDYVNGKMISAPNYIRRKSDLSVVDFSESAFKVKLKNSASTIVLADVVDKDGKNISPAIVLNKYGRGKSIFTANRLGETNFEREVSIGTKWPPVNKNEKAHALLVELVNLISDACLDIKPISIPGKVLMTAYRQDYNGEQNILIHLLNATGAKEMKKDDIVPGVNNSRKAFFEIKENIVFDVKVESISNAYVVSPDYKGEKPVKLEKADNGYLRITVKKEDLQVYSIIYLKLSQ